MNQKMNFSENCAIRGPAPFSPVIVPKVLLPDDGVEVFGSLRMVWLRRSKYSERNGSDRSIGPFNLPAKELTES